MEQNKLYGLICFYALMKTSTDTQAPSYLSEKFQMIEEGKEAFMHLDALRKGFAIGYCHKWGVKIPNEWNELVQSYYK